MGSILVECTYSEGIFLALKKYLRKRKAQERELATFDENRRAVGMLNPMHDKNEGTAPGGIGDDTSDYGLQKIAEGQTSYVLLIIVELESKSGD